MMPAATVSAAELRRALIILQTHHFPVTLDEFRTSVGAPVVRHLFADGLLRNAADEHWPLVALTAAGRAFIQGNTRDHAVPCAVCRQPTFHQSATCEDHR